MPPSTARSRPVVCDWCGEELTIEAGQVPDVVQCPVCGEPVTPR